MTQIEFDSVQSDVGFESELDSRSEFAKLILGVQKLYMGWANSE